MSDTLTLPTRRDEAFRYADLAALAPLAHEWLFPALPGGTAPPA